MLFCIVRILFYFKEKGNELDNEVFEIMIYDMIFFFIYVKNFVLFMYMNIE